MAGRGQRLGGRGGERKVKTEEETYLGVVG